MSSKTDLWKPNQIYDEDDSRNVAFWKTEIYEALPDEPHNPEAKIEFKAFITTMRDKVSKVHMSSEMFSTSEFLIENGYVVPVDWNRYALTKKGYDVGYESNLKLFRITNDANSIAEQVKVRQFHFSEKEKILSPYSFYDLTDGETIFKDISGEINENVVYCYNPFSGCRFYFNFAGNVIGNTAVCVADSLIEMSDKSIDEVKRDILDKHFEEVSALKETEEREKNVMNGRTLLHPEPFNLIAEEKMAEATILNKVSVGNIPINFKKYGFENVFYEGNDRTFKSAQIRAYNAFENLADSLSIKPETIAQSGQIKLVAEPKGTTEPEINYNCKPGYEHFASEWFLQLLEVNRINIYDISNSLKYKPNRNHTEYFMNARKMDEICETMDQSSFMSEKNLVARAFESYVKEKCHEKGIHDIFLCGPKTKYDGLLYPTGEEKKIMFSQFDSLINTLKERGILQPVGLPEMVTEPVLTISDSIMNDISLAGDHPEKVFKVSSVSRISLTADDEPKM